MDDLSNVDLFHSHLDECKQCRDHPFNLCFVGLTILKLAADPVINTLLMKEDFFHVVTLNVDSDGNIVPDRVPYIPDKKLYKFQLKNSRVKFGRVNLIGILDNGTIQDIRYNVMFQSKSICLVEIGQNRCKKLKLDISLEDYHA